MIPNGYFRELTKKYVKHDRELREYRDQFFTHLRDGKITKRATRVLTREELNKLDDMEKKLGVIHDEWVELIRVRI